MTNRPAGGGRVRTVFLGSGAFGVPVLRRLAVHPDVELVAVVTAPPRPAGRKAIPTPTPIGVAAAELGLPLIAPERLRAPESIATVLALRPGLAVLADYGQIVPRPLLDLAHGALNLHPSALPRWRGASPIPATILAGDPSTAVSLMRMDAGLDTGPILAQEPVALDGRETAPVLEARLADLAADLLGAALGPWLRGELAPTLQDEAEATMTRPLRRVDGRLDPGRPASELERRVRAYLPWPGTFIDADGDRVTVTAASVAASRTGDEPGLIVRETDRPALATADGRLVLDRVTPAGSRPMSGADWLRGRRPAAG